VTGLGIALDAQQRGDRVAGHRLDHRRQVGLPEDLALVALDVGRRERHA
jgi:hypothetical protein